MTVKIVELAGKRWAIMPEKDYKRLAAHAGVESDWPGLPKPDAQCNYPAVEYARASLARKIIKARRQAGLTQAELARRASIRPAQSSPSISGSATRRARRPSRASSTICPPARSSGSARSGGKQGPPVQLRRLTDLVRWMNALRSVPGSDEVSFIVMFTCVGT